MQNEEIRTGADFTALYRGGELIATAMLSTATQFWNVTDERNARHIARYDNRGPAEARLKFFR